MMPRFIIGVRELYDRDTHRGQLAIDTGFGALSQLATGRNATMSAIAFEDVVLEEDQAVEGDSEGINEVVRDGAAGQV